MNRKEKIAILKGIQQGTKSLSDLMPQAFRVSIAKNGTTFWKGGQPINREAFEEVIRLNPPNKFNVKIVV